MAKKREKMTALNSAFWITRDIAIDGSATPFYCMWFIRPRMKNGEFRGKGFVALYCGEFERVTGIILEPGEIVKVFIYVKPEEGAKKARQRR